MPHNTDSAKASEQENATIGNQSEQPQEPSAAEVQPTVNDEVAESPPPERLNPPTIKYPDLPSLAQSPANAAIDAPGSLNINIANSGDASRQRDHQPPGQADAQGEYAPQDEVDESTLPSQFDTQLPDIANEALIMSDQPVPPENVNEDAVKHVESAQREQNTEEEVQQTNGDQINEAKSRLNGITAPEFDQTDKEILLYEAKTIYNVPERRRSRAWDHFARVNPKATAEQWEAFFNENVRPIAEKAHRLSEARDLEDQSSDDGSDGTESGSDMSAQSEDERHGEPGVDETSLGKSRSGLRRQPQTPPESPDEFIIPRPRTLSPSVLKQLKQRGSPLVIVPTPSAKHVRFSQERDTILSPIRSQAGAQSQSQSVHGQRINAQPRRSPRKLKPSGTGSISPISKQGPTGNNRRDIETIDLSQHVDEGDTDEESDRNPVANVDGVGASSLMDPPRDFEIFQSNDQPPEDEKENSPKRKRRSRSRERPHDALDLTEKGTEFRLEPTLNFPSIDNVSFSEEDGRLKTPQKLKRRRRSEQGSTRSQRANSQSIFDVISDTDSHVTASKRKRRRLKERASQTNQQIRSDDPSNLASDDVYEDAREVITQTHDSADGTGGIDTFDFVQTQVNHNDSSSSGMQAQRDPQLDPSPQSSPPPYQPSRQPSRNAFSQASRSLQPPPALSRSTIPFTELMSPEPPSSPSTARQHRRTTKSPILPRNQSLEQRSESDESPAFQTNPGREEHVPARYRATTQEILDRETSQRPDIIGMPLPPDTDSEAEEVAPRIKQEEQEQSVPHSQAQHRSQSQSQSQRRSQTPQYQRRYRSTQQILSEPSPQIPLDVPPPPATQHSSNSSTNRPAPSQPSQTPNRISSSPLDQFINYNVSIGHDRDDAINALRCTSFNSVLAQEVLECWQRGEELPRKPGIWTEDDDLIIRGGDAWQIRRLSHFHGDKNYDYRLDLLEAWAEEL